MSENSIIMIGLELKFFIESKINKLLPFYKKKHCESSVYIFCTYALESQKINQHTLSFEIHEQSYFIYKEYVLVWAGSVEGRLNRQASLLSSFVNV